jgi:prepilin-type N-terminal cleavage/methylation domain-containing protein
MVARRVKRIVRRLVGRRTSRGFTLTELLVTITASAVVIFAGFLIYGGMVQSMKGTSALARMQRQSGIAVDVVTRSVREASRMSIPSSDSLLVYYDTASGESLATVFSLDNMDRLIDDTGFVLARTVDSLSFSSPDGMALHMELVLRDSVKSDRTDDDKLVHFSTTVVRRN